MRKLFGAAVVIAVLWGIWVGLGRLDALPPGLRFPTGEYGALLGGRR